MREFPRSSLHGNGAGTFEVTWEAQRPPSGVIDAVDAHSLYAETLDELGLVGLVLLLGALLTMLAVLAWRARGPNRSLYAVIFAVALTWALEAGIDWQWEMPGVTVLVFALGGAGLATRRSPGASRRRS